jgi:hypothetical protein
LTGNLETNPLNLINPPLKIVCCGTTLSNHDIIMIVRFFRKLR